MSRERVLVAYDYGQGAVWAYVTARSADAVAAEFPELTIVGSPPEWLTEAESRRLAVLELDKPSGLLADILRNR